jgi:hypothetical protein
MTKLNADVIGNIEHALGDARRNYHDSTLWDEEECYHNTYETYEDWLNAEFKAAREHIADLRSQISSAHDYVSTLLRPMGVFDYDANLKSLIKSLYQRYCYKSNALAEQVAENARLRGALVKIRDEAADNATDESDVGWAFIYIHQTAHQSLDHQSLD